MAQWKITVDDKHMKLFQKALEFYFRAMMGQEMHIAEELCIDGLGYKHEEFCDRREKVEQALRVAFYTIHAPHTYPQFKSEDTQAAIDMWSEIRHELWKARPDPKPKYTTDAYRPYHQSDIEPLRFERMDSNENENP